MPRMKFENIYFHHDFDGAVSAAILLQAQSHLRKDRLNSTVLLHAVNYQLKNRWASFDLGTNSAIVDFLFHPKAAYWADHHFDPFVNEIFKQNYSENAEKQPWRWSPDKKSCPSLLLSDLYINVSKSTRDHFSDFAYWSDIIDSAQFESAQQAMDLSNPYIALSRVISISNQIETIDIVKKICLSDCASILKSSSIQDKLMNIQDSQNQLVRVIMDSLTIRDKIAVFDQSSIHGEYLRYTPYLIDQSIEYVIGVYKVQQFFFVSVGRNPWMGTSPIHLGEICRDFGGGGHQNVGGASFSEGSIARAVAMKIRERIASALEQGWSHVA